MPDIFNDDLNLFQWGKESSAARGTPVAATSGMAVEDLILTPGGLAVRPNLARGVRARHRGNETVIRHGTNWKIPATPVCYEQLPNLLSMSVQGGVVASGGPTYVYTHTRSLTADPAPDSWTIERRIGGGTPRDERFAYALASKITLKGAIDQLVTVEAEGFGRRLKTNALTAGKTMPTPELVAMADSAAWLDPLWANAGATPLTGMLLGWTVTFYTGLYGQATGDQRADRDFYGYKVDGSKVGIDATLILLMDPTVYAAEATAAEAQTLRCVRIGTAGSAGRLLTIDMNVKHASPELTEIGRQDGQVVTALNFVESADDGTNLFRVAVANKVAAYL